MKKNHTIAGWLMLLALSTCNHQLAASPLGTAFTYQGQLASGTDAANGSYDLKFTLYDALSSGSVAAGPLTNAATSATNGYFTVALDFGAVFDGDARWLEISVRTNGGGAFTTLTPRQALTPTPYSLFASNTAALGGQAPSAFAPASGSTAYVARSGDAMTGTLNLPANGLVAGGSQLVLSSGNVGIGTASPSAPLEVGGTIKATTFQGDGSQLSNIATTPAPDSISASQLTPDLRADAIIPAGSIMSYMGTAAPTGWLLCDGSAVSRSTYARLFATIGSANGNGDGSTTFNLPDLRGVFLRGVDGSAGRDPEKATRSTPKPGGNPGNAVGSFQDEMYKSHVHYADTNYFFTEWHGGAGPYSGWVSAGSSINYVQSTQPSGGSETRPKNIYVNYIIKN
jgi:hypothetical protein